MRALRERRRWTQAQLGTRAGGLNKATIVSVEAMDRNHGRETYAKVASAFGITLAELYALVPVGQKTQRTDRPTSATVVDRFSYTGQDRRKDNLGPPPGTEERREA